VHSYFDFFHPAWFLELINKDLVSCGNCHAEFTLSVEKILRLRLRMTKGEGLAMTYNIKVESSSFSLSGILSYNRDNTKKEFYRILASIL